MSTAIAPHPDDLLRDAIRHHRDGADDRAAATLERIIAQDDQAARALLLLALVRDRQNQVGAAAALLGRYLALCPRDGFALHRLGRLHQDRGDDASACDCFEQAAAARPDHAGGFNDLGAALYRLGATARAEDAFARAVALDPADIGARGNLARLLAAAHRHDDAAAAFRAVLGLAPVSACDWCEHAAAWRALGDLAAAERACRHAVAAEPAGLEGILLLAEILEARERPVEAAGLREKAGRLQGVVVRPCLGRKEARVLLVGGAGLCNLPTEFLIDRKRFETVTIQVPGDGSAMALPEADVAFNIVGDADAGAAFLGSVAALRDRLPCPMLNPPERIGPTRRDRLAAALGDIPGLVVPRLERLGRAALAARAETQPGRALLIRPAGSHGGIGLVRVESGPDIVACLAASSAEAFYVSDYWDFRSADGWFRKYRLVFVGGIAFPVHLAIGADWLVHYWRVGMADWMRGEEDAFLADHRSVFDTTAQAALAAVAARLDLDFAGIDCAVLQDGRVLLFEANATMLVHVTGAAKRAQAEQIRDAVSRRILAKPRPPTLDRVSQS